MPETLADELLLLAYDIRGKCRLGPVGLDYGVGGALLSELNLAGRLKLDGAFLTVTGGAPTGDPILDGLLEEIETAPRSRTPRQWVTRMRATDVRDRVLARMAERGRIETDRHHAFARTRYPVRDIVGLWEAQQRVVAAVTTSAPRHAGPRTLALGALVVATGLSKALFATSGNWRAHRARMRELTRGDWAAEAVRDALAADGRCGPVGAAATPRQPSGPVPAQAAAMRIMERFRGREAMRRNTRGRIPALLKELDDLGR